MNKEEIQKRIKIYEDVRELAEEALNEYNIQLRYLREAEKPKLRHGDFGYTDDGYVRIAIKCREKNDLMQLGHLSMPVDGCQNKMNTVFGNIFDLLKEWSEDLERWKRQKGRNKFYFKLCGVTIDFHTNKYCSFSLSEAEEIWHKLGQMIATLKRKSPQE